MCSKGLRQVKSVNTSPFTYTLIFRVNSDNTPPFPLLIWERVKINMYIVHFIFLRQYKKTFLGGNIVSFQISKAFAIAFSDIVLHVFVLCVCARVCVMHRLSISTLCLYLPAQNLSPSNSCCQCVHTLLWWKTERILPEPGTSSTDIP